MKKHLGVSLSGGSFPRVQERAFLSKSDVGHSVEVSRHECEEGGFHLELMMPAHDIKMEDISNVFFDTIYGMSNIWYF